MGVDRVEGTECPVVFGTGDSTAELLKPRMGNVNVN